MFPLGFRPGLSTGGGKGGLGLRDSRPPDRCTDPALPYLAGPRGGLAPSAADTRLQLERRGGEEPGPGRRSLAPAASHTRNFHFPGGGRGDTAGGAGRGGGEGAGSPPSPRGEGAAGYPRRGGAGIPPAPGERSALSPAPREAAGSPPAAPPLTPPASPRPGSPRRCRGIPSPPAQVSAVRRSTALCRGRRVRGGRTDTDRGVVSYS